VDGRRRYRIDLERGTARGRHALRSRNAIGTRKR
jgi:hypothetical protein